MKQSAKGTTKLNVARDQDELVLSSGAVVPDGSEPASPVGLRKAAAAEEPVKPGFCRPLVNVPASLFHGTTIPAAIKILESGQLQEGTHWGKPNEPHGPRLTTEVGKAEEFSGFPFNGDPLPGGVVFEFDGEAMAKAHDLVEYADTWYGGDAVPSESEVVALVPALPVTAFLKAVHVKPIPQGELQEIADYVAGVWECKSEDFLAGYRLLLKDALLHEKGPIRSLADAMTGPILDEPKGPKPPPAVQVWGVAQRETKAFKDWFGDSKVVDGEGNPQVVYRGFRRVPKPDSFNTRLGRATLSFTADAALASVYAHNPETHSYKRGCHVMPVYLSIQKPLDLRDLGEHASLLDVFEKLNWNYYQERGEGTEVGYLDMADAIETLDRTAHNSMAQFDIDASKPGECCGISEFDVLAEAIREVGEPGTDDSSQHIQDMLFRTKIDLYALADNEEFVTMLTDRGYDGIIHMDPVTEEGLNLYREGGNPDLLEESIKGNTRLVETWRPLGAVREDGMVLLPMFQIKSALGNVGNFDRGSQNILE